MFPIATCLPIVIIIITIFVYIIYIWTDDISSQLLIPVSLQRENNMLSCTKLEMMSNTW